MEGARYHRYQAEQCLQMAQLMTDPLAASLLREAAARHFALALEDEAKTKEHSAAEREGKEPDDVERLSARPLKE
jgi:hypothetical protein